MSLSRSPSSHLCCFVLKSQFIPTPVSPWTSLTPLFYPSGFWQLLPPRLPEASKECQQSWRTSYLSLPTAVTQQQQSDGKVLPAFPQHFEAADYRVQSSESLDIILKVSSEQAQIATFQSVIETQIWEGFHKGAKGILHKFQVYKTIRTSQLNYLKWGSASDKAFFP